MKIALGGLQPILAAVLAFGIVLVEPAAAQEPTAVSFVVSKADKECDQFNRSWVVTSQHTYLSIKVRVRWAAVGAKVMQEDFVLSPGASRGIGCAADLQIVSAELMQF